MLTFIGVHAYVIKNLADDITGRCNEIKKLVSENNWEKTEKKLDEIHELWHKKRLWTSLTISTKDIEQLEISLEQSREYARLGAKCDFMGEFIMFSMLLDHLPHQEGFHIEEIL